MSLLVALKNGYRMWALTQAMIASSIFMKYTPRVAIFSCPEGAAKCAVWWLMKVKRGREEENKTKIKQKGMFVFLC